jgi:hypothetical protein
MAMQDEGTATPGVKPKTKKQVSPVRNIIGLAVLIGCSAIAFIEYNANHQYNAGVTKLDATLAKEEGDMLSKDQVEAMLGKAPDSEPVVQGDELKATYTWKGVFRTYSLTTYYTNQKPPKLRRTESEKAPAK